MIYLIALLSMSIHNLSRILDAVKKHKDDFNIIVWFLNPLNYLYIIISFLTVVMLLLSINIEAMELIEIGGIKFKLSYIVSIVIGYMPASIINAILQKFKG